MIQGIRGVPPQDLFALEMRLGETPRQREKKPDDATHSRSPPQNLFALEMWLERLLCEGNIFSFEFYDTLERLFARCHRRGWLN
jgi:hypothetical protein